MYKMPLNLKKFWLKQRFEGAIPTAVIDKMTETEIDDFIANLEDEDEDE